MACRVEEDAEAGGRRNVGFTGADGGSTSTQVVSNFFFVSIPPVAVAVNSGQIVVSSPEQLSGYTLQQNSNLATNNWVDLTNQPTEVNGQNQFVVPITSTNEFYRLILR